MITILEKKTIGATTISLVERTSGTWKYYATYDESTGRWARSVDHGESRDGAQSYYRCLVNLAETGIFTDSEKR